MPAAMGLLPISALCTENCTRLTPCIAPTPRGECPATPAWACPGTQPAVCHVTAAQCPSFVACGPQQSIACGGSIACGAGFGQGAAAMAAAAPQAAAFGLVATFGGTCNQGCISHPPYCSGHCPFPVGFSMGCGVGFGQAGVAPLAAAAAPQAAAAFGAGVSHPIHCIISIECSPYICPTRLCF
jgi:hypothetical protein